MSKKSNVNQIQVLNTFHVLQSTTQVAKQLNLKLHQVQWILKKNNLMPSMQKSRRKYKADYFYFNTIDTVEKAYWLGFLYADGCILDHDKKASKKLEVSLKSTDFNHLQKFKIALNSTHPIHVRTIKTGIMKGKQYCSFQIRSEQLCNDLISKGCTPRKSLTLEFPKLNKNLISHFIRGYFDGDGSVFISNEKHWRNGRISSVIHYRFIGTEQFLITINNMINLNGMLRQVKNSKAFELSYKRNKKLIPFYKYLYQDAILYLERKKSIFDLYLQEQGSETIIS